eukprot:13651975-Alexandrium_andersonii.AAC.1
MCRKRCCPAGATPLASVDSGSPRAGRQRPIAIAAAAPRCTRSQGRRPRARMAAYSQRPSTQLASHTFRVGPLGQQHSDN